MQICSSRKSGSSIPSTVPSSWMNEGQPGAINHPSRGENNFPLTSSAPSERTSRSATMASATAPGSRQLHNTGQEKPIDDRARAGGCQEDFSACRFDRCEGLPAWKEGTRRQKQRRPRMAAGGNARMAGTQWSSFSISSSYSFASSSSSSSPRSLGRITKIQPSPNASSLMVSGLSLSSSLISTISPDTGA